MATETSPQFNAQELLELYSQKQYDQLSEKFLEILRHFEQQTYFEVNNQSQYFIISIFQNF